jgi:hypothetical protein
MSSPSALLRINSVETSLTPGILRMRDSSTEPVLSEVEGLQMTEGAKKVLVCCGTSLSNTPSMSVPVVPEEQGEQNARAGKLL